jgi:hypothetical protein
VVSIDVHCRRAHHSAQYCFAVVASSPRPFCAACCCQYFQFSVFSKSFATWCVCVCLSLSRSLARSLSLSLSLSLLLLLSCVLCVHELTAATSLGVNTLKTICLFPGPPTLSAAGANTEVLRVEEDNSSPPPGVGAGAAAEDRDDAPSGGEAPVSEGGEGERGSVDDQGEVAVAADEPSKCQ